MEDIFEEVEDKEESGGSKDWFNADDISQKSQRYDKLYYKEWEEIEEIKVIDTKLTSQQNFTDGKHIVVNNIKLGEQHNDHFQMESTHSIHGFQSVHGLIH